MSHLHRSIGLVLAIALVALAQHSAHAAPIAVYEYDTVNYLPTSQGWTGPTTSPTVTATNNLVDSALRLEDTAVAAGPIISHAISPADYGGAWVATATVRVDSANSSAAYLLGVSTASNYWNLRIDATSGTLKAYTSIGDVIVTLYSVPTLATAFHKYQFVGNGDNSPELWVDGVQTGVFVPGYTGYAGANAIRFGADWSGGTEGVANVRRLRFDTGNFEVPEPASLGLLSLGGLLLLRKRR